jgi:Nucleotidyl transferase AbiEii toxin, Type IV TA system
VKEIHERLARIGLAVTEHHGFVLAGGYALSANGFGDRPSMDVDLFTKDMSPENFTRAVDELTAAYERDGLAVSVRTRADLFVNLDVHDPVTGESSELQLGWDYREFPPARLDIGPVLNERDAVANKMTALFSRGEVRDFIDIDTVVQSDRFTREDVLALADTRESLPIDRTMLAQRFEMLSDPRHAAKYDEAEFADYGVDADKRTAIIDRFGQWATEIDPARAGERVAAETAQERTAATPAVGMSEDLSAVRAAFPGSARDAVRAPRSPQAGPTSAYRPPEYGRGQGTER